MHAICDLLFLTGAQQAAHTASSNLIFTRNNKQWFASTGLSHKRILETHVPSDHLHVDFSCDQQTSFLFSALQLCHQIGQILIYTNHIWLANQDLKPKFGTGLQILVYGQIVVHINYLLPELARRPKVKGWRGREGPHVNIGLRGEQERNMHTKHSQMLGRTEFCLFP